jgi:hypothetical protein
MTKGFAVVQCSVQDGEGGLLDYDLTVMSSTRSRIRLKLAGNFLNGKK